MQRFDIFRNFARKSKKRMHTVRPANRKKQSGIEQAMEDVRKGRITEWGSAEEMFKTLGV